MMLINSFQPGTHMSAWLYSPSSTCSASKTARDAAAKSRTLLVARSGFSCEGAAAICETAVGTIREPGQSCTQAALEAARHRQSRQVRSWTKQRVLL